MTSPPQITGLDVTVDSLHADYKWRASLVFDWMESPPSGRRLHIFFTWASTQRWRRADCVVDRQGVIRVHPHLTRIAATKALVPDAVVREEINAYVSLLRQLSTLQLKHLHNNHCGI